MPLKVKCECPGFLKKRGLFFYINKIAKIRKRGSETDLSHIVIIFGQ